jgi:hypothetical protein
MNGRSNPEARSNKAHWSPIVLVVGTVLSLFLNLIECWVLLNGGNEPAEPAAGKSSERNAAPRPSSSASSTEIAALGSDGSKIDMFLNTGISFADGAGYILPQAIARKAYPFDDQGQLAPVLVAYFDLNSGPAADVREIYKRALRIVTDAEKEYIRSLGTPPPMPLDLPAFPNEFDAARLQMRSELRALLGQPRGDTLCDYLTGGNAMSGSLLRRKLSVREIASPTRKVDDVYALVSFVAETDRGPVLSDFVASNAQPNVFADHYFGLLDWWELAKSGAIESTTNDQN